MAELTLEEWKAKGLPTMEDQAFFIFDKPRRTENLEKKSSDNATKPSEKSSETEAKVPPIGKSLSGKPWPKTVDELMEMSKEDRMEYYRQQREWRRNLPDKELDPFTEEEEEMLKDLGYLY